MTAPSLPASSAGSSTFGSLPVGETLARALGRMGYSEPTPIQEQAIPALREGRDVLGQAQTGTGKTAGFGIPLIEAIDPRQRYVQAIVLLPTRELCLQVADELGRLAQFTGIRVAAIYGGVGFGKQLEALRSGAQIVAATPGRVEDLINRGDLRLDRVRFAVLDEADRMLDVGFLPAIERILRQTPAQRQTSLFSATIPDDVRGLAHRQMNDPVTIAVDPERPTVELIEQRYEEVLDGDKLRALQAHLDDPACFLALVFRRTTYKADRLVRDLQRHGYKAAVLHGRRSQSQREKVLADLKSAKLQVLVATDIAARGLDIANLTHVFNFDLPDTPETYVHRIGRTGRAGETGVAITLIGPEDEEGLRALKKYLARREAGDQGSGERTAKPRAGAGKNRSSGRGRQPGNGNASGRRDFQRAGEPGNRDRNGRRRDGGNQTGPDRGPRYRDESGPTANGGGRNGERRAKPIEGLSTERHLVNGRPLRERPPQSRIERPA